MGCVLGQHAVSQVSDHSAHSFSEYDLHEVLGEGAHGVVRRATHKPSGTEVAVKMVDRFQAPRHYDIDKEIAMMQRLQHPSVAKLHSVLHIHDQLTVCLVMELYQGGNMIQGVVAHWEAHGKMHIRSIQNLSRQMWGAVAFVKSRNCVHRDVKGDNFMMDMKDVAHPDNKIYLSDFDTACECLPGKRLTKNCGTRRYWSPEFFQQNYAHKVDVWALGVVMFGLVSGAFPFRGEQEVQRGRVSVPRHCPAACAELIRAALERQESRRPEAVQLAAHAFLDAPAAGEDVAAAPPRAATGGAAPAPAA
mmetsp:Transcript_50502/g.153626  ORF Transcript_50502/g.153626 Transcript_50502/m.153626 type:complete len:305 (-) Transcript_50502:145-1059(-)|eukprot:CAMPEP_0198493124 /NCGR_PEP_ID=MMETSP1462-20131121/3830_1 /TAXON_ID=1333877 /ORGANISM="Brandtodinium nutriculum, Strain RCC3387" /LENGTH=304 /DNA_ID=CAMNT_0044221799 /DNA_START=61 /DNA_END=975 /DNA_ORIENTATION=-